MDEIVLIFVFIIIPLVGLVFVLPITAMVKASRAKRSIVFLEDRLEALYEQVMDLTRQVAESRTDIVSKVEAVPSEAPIVAPTSDSNNVAYEVQEEPSALTDESNLSVSNGLDGESPAPEALDTEESPHASPSLPSESVAPTVDAADDTEPLPDESPRPTTSIEERIGVVWFTRIGALVGMVVAAWFFKYMVDNNWIGPWGRVALGALAGGLSLGIGEFLYRRKRTHPMFNQGLLGLGLALLLITAYASFSFYHLVSAVTAFGVVAIICLLGGALSHFHKSELILIFSLLAAFLNPVMLSTGVDRPFALFSYLLLMTAGAYVPAVIHGFRGAAFIAVAGVVALFTGWYIKFFDIDPVPPVGIYDAPELNRPGAYFSMAKRWIPILFTTLFVGEWIVAGLLHLRKTRSITGVVLLLIAAAGSHGAMAALLYDRPIGLGIALLIFGLLFAVLLIRNRLTEWLFLTMSASFVILACLRDQLERGDLLPLMFVSGLISAIYFGIFVRAAVQKERHPSPMIQWLLAGAGVGFFLLGALFLMPHYPLHLAGFATSLTGVFLLTALIIASPAMFIGTSVIGFIGFLIAVTERAEDIDAGLIAISGGWFLLHTGVISYDALKRRREWTMVHMSVLSFAGIGFAGIFLSATPEDAGILRALLALGEGIVYLLVGVSTARSAAGRHAPLLPLGMAALAFTAATGFLLSGASLTAAWAAETAVLAYLASRSSGREVDGNTHPGWVVASIALFLITAVHLLSIDVPWVGDQQSTYIHTQGASGLLLPDPFMHPLAWALSASATALLFSVFIMRQSRDRLSRAVRLGYLVTGHLSLLVLFIHEFRLIFTEKPLIPGGLPSDELVALWHRYQSVVDEQAMQLQTVTTVVMGVFALLLIVLGFVIRDAWHRRLGIILFAVTLVKLSLFDIWKFETLLRIIVGGAVAFLLLLSGFLYARFGHRLKSIVSDNGDKAAGVLFVILLTSAGVNAQALETARYVNTIPVSGITEAGDYIVEVTPVVYQASLSGRPLSDIRIAGPDGAEIPYALFSNERIRPPRLADARILDPQELPDGAFRAVLDLGETPPIHFRIHLRLTGANYLRTTQIESSADGVTFGVIAENEPVYDIPSAHVEAVKQTLEYPESGARYLRVTLRKGMDTASVRIVGARYEAVGRRPLRDTHREIALSLETAFEDTDGCTVHPLIKLPDKIPFRSLRIETDSPEFVREIKLETSTHKNAWFSGGTWTVYRIRRGAAPANTVERLRIPTGVIERPFVRLRVDNGDNTPLDITAVHAEYTAEALVLRAATPGPHTLYIGHKKADAPRYDLAALLLEGSFTKYRPATLGAVEDNPHYRKAHSPKKTVPWTETHATIIKIAILIAALLLLIWTIRLLMKSKKR